MVGWVVAAVVVLAACAGEEADADVVTVAIGPGVEGQVLAALAAVALDAHNVEVVVVGDVGGTIELRRELLNGRVDIGWDYTGAAWSLGMGQQAPPTDPAESFDRVAEADRTEGLTWLGPTAADATLALFVRAEDVPGADAPTMTWLAGQLSGGEWGLCIDPDFRDQPDGLDALADEYTIDRTRLEPQLVAVGEEEAVAGVADGTCRAGLGTATSGPARSAGLVSVVDDRRVFPAFVVAPVVRTATLDAYPEVADVLAEVVALIDTDSLAELNAATERGAEPQEVAEAFLADVLSDTGP